MQVCTWKGDVWRLAAITNRQEENHLTIRITNYDEAAYAWSFAGSSIAVATRREVNTLKQYLIPTGARMFGKRQRLYAPLFTLKHYLANPRSMKLSQSKSLYMLSTVKHCVVSSPWRAKNPHIINTIVFYITGNLNS